MFKKKWILKIYYIVIGIVICVNIVIGIKLHQDRQQLKEHSRQLKEDIQQLKEHNQPLEHMNR